MGTGQGRGQRRGDGIGDRETYRTGGGDRIGDGMGWGQESLSFFPGPFLLSFFILGL